MYQKKLLILASGKKNGGGSGLLHLIYNQLAGNLDVNIEAVVSNHEFGGVRKIANYYHIPFVFLPSKKICLGAYRNIFNKFKPDFIALTGWLFLIEGHDPSKTINIHPGLTNKFGGKGMYGQRVHKATLDAFLNNEITHTAVTMHFVDDEYDRGPEFFEHKIWIDKNESVLDLASKVNEYEHGLQWLATNLVVTGQISWSGKKEDKVSVPEWYKELSFCPKNCK